MQRTCKEILGASELGISAKPFGNVPGRKERAKKSWEHLNLESHRNPLETFSDAKNTQRNFSYFVAALPNAVDMSGSCYLLQDSE